MCFPHCPREGTVKVQPLGCTFTVIKSGFWSLFAHLGESLTNIKQMKFTRKSELTTSVTRGVPSMVLQMSLSFSCAQKCILAYGDNSELRCRVSCCKQWKALLSTPFVSRSVINSWTESPLLMLRPRIDTGYVPFIYFVATIQRSSWVDEDLMRSWVTFGWGGFSLLQHWCHLTIRLHRFKS